MIENPKIESSPDRVCALAGDLIAGCRALCLATAHNDGPWAAPVYYVTGPSGFYFFSSPDSRHIKEALASNRAAGSIYAESDSWENLRGLQMAGTVAAVGTGPRAAAILAAYLIRFPFVKTMAGAAGRMGPADFFNLFRVKLYIFRPETILYMDNSISFGFRQPLSLKDVLP
jgi:uncharacterized protein